ncbi:dockerin type I repeat-containing protein [Ruminococcus sp.]|uniref:dockerin type I repeat-containing protein n=1 Tax=Ruminococcus sp. TaxID=41978 RepID=UPI0038910F19
MQKLRRPLVVLLVFIMFVSLFAAVPVTANADTAFESVDLTKYYQVINGSYHTKDYVGENVSVIASSVIVESDENGWYLKPDEVSEIKALKGKMISKLVVHTAHSDGAPVVSFHAENNDMITASSVEGNTYTFENINSNKVYVYADQALQEDQKVQLSRIDVYFTEKAFFNSRSISIGSDILINFFIDPSAAWLEPGESGELTVNYQWEDNDLQGDIASQSTTVAVDSSNYASPGDLIMVTCHVSVVEMSSTVIVNASLGGKTYTYFYSALGYCDSFLHAPDEWIASYNASLPEGSTMTYDKLSDLITKMLDFVVKAQKLFNVFTYSETEEAISGYVMQDVTPEMLDQAVYQSNVRSADDIAAAEETCGAKYCTAGLSLLKTNSLRLYFTESAEPFNPKDYDGAKGDYSYVQNSDIKASELDDLQSFTVGDATLYYSALDYAKDVLESDNSSEELKDLAKAMYWYNRAAEALIGDKEAVPATATYTLRDEKSALEPTESVPFYVAGSMTDWEADDSYQMKRSESADAVEYQMITRFKEGDEFKVIMDNDQEIAWHPDGEGNSFKIAESGLYNVFFRPNADGGDGWHCGMITVERMPATIYFETLDVGEAITNADKAFHAEDHTVICKGGGYASFDGDKTEVQTDDKAFPEKTFYYNLKNAVAYDIALNRYLEPYEAILCTEAFDRYVPCDKDGSRTDALYIIAKTDDTITLGGHQGVILGDADLNGEADITDATLIQRYDIKAVTFGEMQRKAADVDGDGEASVIDVTLIQYFATGMTVKYPINEYV